MFSDEGNVAVHHLVTTLARQLEQGAFRDEDYDGYVHGLWRL
jgi:hypothetical protein